MAEVAVAGKRGHGERERERDAEEKGKRVHENEMGGEGIGFSNYN